MHDARLGGLSGVRDLSSGQAARHRPLRGARRCADLPVSAAPDGHVACRVRARVPVHAVVDLAPRAASLAGTPLRRDPRLQSARPLLPDRMAVPAEGRLLRLRSARRRSGDPPREARRGARQRHPGTRRGVGRAVHVRARRRRHRSQRFLQTPGDHPRPQGPRRRVRRAQRPPPGGVLARPLRRLRPPRTPLPRRLPGRDGQAGRRGPAGARRGTSGARGVRHPAVPRRRRRVSWRDRGPREGIGHGGQRDHARLPDPRGVHARAQRARMSASLQTRRAPSTTSRR